ncbi:hypothetical protein BR93DRAFT_927582 [Coniochaeta sp. PMI_546]|nr:hypothetical protein BR93DRAFT_927582 [Coniochaeta sp. PMI_546]
MTQISARTHNPGTKPAKLRKGPWKPQFFLVYRDTILVWCAALVLWIRPTLKKKLRRTMTEGYTSLVVEAGMA